MAKYDERFKFDVVQRYLSGTDGLKRVVAQVSCFLPLQNHSSRLPAHADGETIEGAHQGNRKSQV